MAGLLAARVLRDHFDHVTIIERDKLPEGPEFRPGVPQARHAHALLAQGQQIMEDLFPGLKADFAEMGAPSMVWGKETAMRTAGGWVKRFDSGITTNVCSRVALEWHVRRRLLRHRNVTILEGQQVSHLLTDAAGTTIIGVEIETRRGTDSRPLYADLIVDASGRSSHMPQWLQALGYDAPEESIVNAHLGYATRWYEIPAGFECDWKVMTIGTQPDTGLLRGGGIFHVEGNRWLVIAAGTNKDYPPTEEAAFTEFIKSLPSLALYEAVQHAQPVSPIYGYRRTENLWHHYERLNMPERLVVIGDAYCGFNPIYGQGMTVAALDALALQSLLRERGTDDLTGFGRAAHQRLAKAVKNAWLMATGEDLRYPLTEGQSPSLLDRLTQKYMDWVLRALTDDETAALAFMQAMNLSRPPISLFHPRIAWRVLRESLRSKRDKNRNAPRQGFRPRAAPAVGH